MTENVFNLTFIASHFAPLFLMLGYLFILINAMLTLRSLFKRVPCSLIPFLGTLFLLMGWGFADQELSGFLLLPILFDLGGIPLLVTTVVGLYLHRNDPLVWKSTPQSLLYLSEKVNRSVVLDGERFCLFVNGEREWEVEPDAITEIGNMTSHANLWTDECHWVFNAKVGMALKTFYLSSRWPGAREMMSILGMRMGIEDFDCVSRAKVVRTITLWPPEKRGLPFDIIPSPEGRSLDQPQPRRQ